MLVLTQVMKPPQVRIGSLGPINFGRTVPLVQLLGGGFGAIVGALVGLFVSPDPLLAFLYGGSLGALVALAALSWSPLPGESFAKWLGLRVLSTRQAHVEINGETSRVYVGIAPVSRVAAGTVHMTAGAVPAAVDAYDDRGVPLDPALPRP